MKTMLAYTPPCKNRTSKPIFRIRLVLQHFPFTALNLFKRRNYKIHLSIIFFSFSIIQSANSSSYSQTRTVHEFYSDASNACIDFIKPWYRHPDVEGEGGLCTSVYSGYDEYAKSCFYKKSNPDLASDPDYGLIPDENEYYAVYGQVFLTYQDRPNSPELAFLIRCDYYPKENILPHKFYASFDEAYEGCNLAFEKIYGWRSTYVCKTSYSETKSCFDNDMTESNVESYGDVVRASGYDRKRQLKYDTCHFYDHNSCDNGTINVDTGECSLPQPEPLKSAGSKACSAGNPIHIASGNKFQQETIYTAPLPLRLNYNSSTGQWLHTYSPHIETIDVNTLLLMRPDGKGLNFTYADNRWQGDADIFYQINDYTGTSSLAVWQVTTPQGNIELYDGQGRLLAITTPQGDSTTLNHNQLNTTVTSHLDDTLQLSYSADDHLLTALLNDSISSNFEYDSNNRLIARTDSGNNRTQYHYENPDFPNHLTGITGPDGVRFASWNYDEQGRGILSEHAGQERTSLVFNEDGSTTVTNPLGKQTTYQFSEIEGLKRPTRIEGHATEHCIGANKEYSYYDSGLLKAKTDWTGNTTRYEYNERGLITRIVEAEGTPEQRITEQLWHDNLPRLLERIKGNQRTRFSYDSSNQLVNTELDILH